MMRILTPETLNSLEVIQVEDYMKKYHPNKHYDVRSGNNCVWVSWGSSSSPIDLYFIFKDGKIADIQVD